MTLVRVIAIPSDMCSLPVYTSLVTLPFILASGKKCMLNGTQLQMLNFLNLNHQFAALFTTFYLRIGNVFSLGFLSVRLSFCEIVLKPLIYCCGNFFKFNYQFLVLGPR